MVYDFCQGVQAIYGRLPPLFMTFMTLHLVVISAKQLSLSDSVHSGDGNALLWQMSELANEIATAQLEGQVIDPHQ